MDDSFSRKLETGISRLHPLLIANPLPRKRGVRIEAGVETLRHLPGGKEGNVCRVRVIMKVLMGNQVGLRGIPTLNHPKP
jgi:hypothetical protein